MKITVDKRALNALERQAKRAKRKLEDRTRLHEEFQRYASRRWVRNLIGGGRFYGAFAALKDSTKRVRRWRGYATGPILYQTDAAGHLRPWMRDAVEDADIVIAPAFSSTQWKFTWSGGKDGSYAVLHDQGYIAGGAGRFASFRGKRVPQRVLFDLNDEDYDELITRTGKYVDSAMGGII